MPHLETMQQHCILILQRLSKYPKDLYVQTVTASWSDTTFRVMPGLCSQRGLGSVIKRDLYVMSLNRDPLSELAV